MHPSRASWKILLRRALDLSGLRDLRADVRDALRQCRRAPLVTLIVAASLALTIGANTAIFSVANGLILRPLPVADPDRLVIVSTASSIAQGYPAGYDNATWEQIRQLVRADDGHRPFEGALAWSGVGPSAPPFDLAQGGEAEPADGLLVSGEFFSTLGVPALLGRTFTAADDVRGGGPFGPMAVISYGLWQRRFGGATDVIGRLLLVDRVAFTIAGVTPPEFHGVQPGQSFDVAIPIGTEPLLHGKDSRLGIQFLSVMLRLAPGQSIEAAQAALRGAQADLAAAAAMGTPESRAAFTRDPLTLVSGARGASALREQYTQPLIVLLSIAAFVLLIACGNVANVMLARAGARRHEMGVRLALGASRWRLARRCLVDSLLLASGGAALGVLFAMRSRDLLVSQLSTWADRVVLPAPIDGTVLIFTTAIVVATATLFGIAPAMVVARADPNAALKGSSSFFAERGFFRARRLNLSSGLVIAQVALSVTLVMAAGLFVRTFAGLATMPLGFDESRVLIVDVDASRVNEPERRLSLYQRLADDVSSVPGVARAAVSINTPLNKGVSQIGEFAVPGHASLSERERIAVINYITPGWFAAYGTAVRAGRELDARDMRTGADAVVVNESFVRQFFGHANRVPVGETIVASGPSGERPRIQTIVGIVANAADMTLRDERPPAVYEPLAQWPMPSTPPRVSLSVRAAGAMSPAMLTPSIAAALNAAEPRLSFSVRPLADQVDAALTQERLLAMLSAFFGGLALMLAALGLYGVTLHAVGERRAEIGIRLALGAEPGGILRLVLARVGQLVAAGVIAGTLASLALSRLVASLVFGIEPRDPISLAVAALTLALAGALAGWLPARQASRCDPARVLRDG